MPNSSRSVDEDTNRYLNVCETVSNNSASRHIASQLLQPHAVLQCCKDLRQFRPINYPSAVGRRSYNRKSCGAELFCSIACPGASVELHPGFIDQGNVDNLTVTLFRTLSLSNPHGRERSIGEGLRLFCKAPHQNQRWTENSPIVSTSDCTCLISAWLARTMTNEHVIGKPDDGPPPLINASVGSITNGRKKHISYVGWAHVKQPSHSALLLMIGLSNCAWPILVECRDVAGKISNIGRFFRAFMLEDNPPETSGKSGRETERDQCKRYSSYVDLRRGQTNVNRTSAGRKV